MDEWLKNLELSILQVVAAEMYFETRHIINQKVQNKIAFIFREIADVVMATHVKFQDTSKQKQENLRNLLLVENRTLVKMLRQQKLPELLDTIIQVLTTAHLTEEGKVALEPFQTSKFDEFPEGINATGDRMRDMMEVVEGIPLP